MRLCCKIAVSVSYNGEWTGEWKVPVGGMGRVVDELMRVARSGGAEMLTKVDLKALKSSNPKHSVEFELDGRRHKIDARFVLVNFGRNVLANLLGQNYEPDSTHEGSVLKINLLLRRLPHLLASGHAAADAFCGTFHVDEGYDQMKMSFHQSRHLTIPDKIPCELYCHTLTDDSILSSDLRTQGFHTLTLFALDVPWRLFSTNNEATRELVTRKCLDGLNRWLAEPIEDCLARTQWEICVLNQKPRSILNESLASTTEIYFMEH